VEVEKEVAMKVLRGLRDWWLVHRSDRSLTKAYAWVGEELGEAVSYSYMGEPDGFEELLDEWGRLEGEYARRGFHTIPLLDFVVAGGNGRRVDGLSEWRANNEKLILHAEVYRNWRGEHSSATSMINLVNDGVQVGTLVIPDTTVLGQ
jgi:hypothetical protein